MQQQKKQKSILIGLAVLAAFACSTPDPAVPTVFAGTVPPEHANDITQGTLIRLEEDGKPAAGCPLKHTDVNADISGFLARVTVTQKFQNPHPEAIEAVYVFPLPQAAAVDDMTMTIGDRTVKGKIKEREEARRIYEEAKRRGNLASLLDQERPNIFTQAVANIPPGASVDIEISYVETLDYEKGRYEFSFPMVVGPRYVPGNPTSHTGGGWAPNTDQVPDASHITPSVAPPGTRAGHDIAINVKLDAGLPVDRIVSKTHEVDLDRRGRRGAEIRLRKKSVLPNKDFILNYNVAGGEVQDALLMHRADRGGFFTMILQPPERVTQEDVTPKELVFVLDVSGSMSGFPIEK
ncbi:MAG: trypsin, partial [bacterium]|nr:trypsin [bacterium]